MFYRSSNFLENHIFDKFSKFSENRENESSLRGSMMGQGGFVNHPTSASCGNFVDGLPHDCHTEPR